MESEIFLAKISRAYLKSKRVIRYRMKKIDDLSDIDIINVCHWYCSENNQIDSFEQYRTKVESQYYYCSYLHEYVDEGSCYDIQMISNGYIKDSAITEYKLNIEEVKSSCRECKYKIV